MPQINQLSAIAESADMKPHNAPKLFDWQKPHAETLLTVFREHNLALDASDLGTGKTVVACHIAKTLGLDMVVICPKIIRPAWAYWMEQFGLSGVVGNWELARVRGLPRRERTIYVFDEVHMAGGYKTKNAKLLINTFEARLPILMLSGTAIESPLRMWALGYLFRFHNLRDFYRWGFRNGVKRNYGFPGYHFESSPKILERIHAHIFPEWGARMRKNLIPGFPECQYMIEMIDPGQDKRLEKWLSQISIREAQHQLKMAQKEAKSASPWAKEPSDALSELLFARMKAEIAKTPALVEEALECVEMGLSPVIFINFLPTLDALLTFLEDSKVPLAKIHGGQDIEERNYEIARFEADQARIMVSTIDSGGAGIDLHDVRGEFPRVSLVCPTWRATTLRQALGRVHRAGGRSKTLQKLVFASGTVEEDIAERVRAKLNQIDAINDMDLAEEEFAYA